MNAPLLAALFAVDALLVATLAWLLVRHWAPELDSALDRLMALGLAGVASIAAAGVALGEIGALHLPGFLGLHVLAVGTLGLARKSALHQDLAAARAFPAQCCRALPGSRLELWLLGALLAVFAAFAIAAFWSQPVVFDALTYRLARVGHWLQDARIAVIPTDDARLNYMPVVPDLVMAWLLTASPAGFQPAALAQTIGGGLMLAATVGLARLTGLSRATSCGAALLALGLPNVAPQFTAAYTDLFTTGMLAAGLCLWLGALRRGLGSVFGGLGAALALGSKGTTAYIAPGLAFVVLWLAWRHRAPGRAWGRTLIAAAAGALILAGPSTARNLQAFGGPAGPRDFIVWHHGETSGLRASLEKLHLNLAATLAQLFEPNSQPPWAQAASRAIGESIARGLPTSDPFTFDEMDRRANLKKVFAIAAPDADVTSTGLTLPLLGVAALIVALRRRRQADAQLVLAWTLIVAAFFVVLHARILWHPYLYRFVVLVVPWMAVIAAWWLAGLRGFSRVIAWIVVGAGTAHGLIAGSFLTYQSGWPAATAAGQSLGYHVFHHWRAWSRTLEPSAGPLRPHLPRNQPLAAFLRRADAQLIGPGRLSRLASTQAEQCVAPGTGWLIVPAARFVGREGQVVARTWLLDGDEQNIFSLAAYRALRPGEQPPPVLYRNRVARPDGGRARRELLVRTWDDAPLRIELLNPAAEARDFELRSPLGTVAGKIEPRQRHPIEVRVPAHFPALLTLEWPTGDATQPSPILARLLP